MPDINKKASDMEVDSTEEKIRSLQEMIANAERTITSAKQMLGQIQKTGGPSGSMVRPVSSADGQIIHGEFDGQIMIGEDGKQYPVPANYASKSKLVEGDMLKLTITPEGNFVYKQIGPAERRFVIGLVQQDERGNYIVSAEDKKYKVLLAAATYFKIELGDEVTIVVPRDGSSVWCAIENIVRKSADMSEEEPTSSVTKTSKPAAIERLEREMEEERKSRLGQKDILDEWEPDIEALKKEASQPVGAETDDYEY